MTLNGSNWEVSGVTSFSFATECGEENKPTIYANAFGTNIKLIIYYLWAITYIFTAVREWIATTTESEECPRGDGIQS